MFFQGWDYWIHRINYGTYTAKVRACNLPTKFEAFDEGSLEEVRLAAPHFDCIVVDEVTKLKGGAAAKPTKIWRTFKKFLHLH